jgi:ketosteroid isomerase-like protein
MRQLVIFAFVAVAMLCAPSAAFCDDLDDLKAAHEAFYKALNERSVNGLLAILHEDVAVFLRDNPLPSRRPTAEVLKAAWADLERNNWIALNHEFAVVGDTGIVWGHSRNVRKMKDGPEETVFSRGSLTYVKSGGKWLLLSIHASAVPSGN